MEDLVIIGGGVAGLSALNACLDKHISPLLIEASTIATPKMCGEFLAPPVISQFKQWEMDSVQSIKQVRFHCGDKVLSSVFPNAAGAFSRQDAERALVARAKSYGGRIMEQALIKTLIPATQHTPYVLHLQSGQRIDARAVMFATGRFLQSPIKPGYSPFIGFKTHIPSIIQSETLLMFGFTGGYLGIVPISSTLSNLTALVHKNVIQKSGSSPLFLEQFIQAHGADLNRLLPWEASQCLDWLQGDAPVFGLKNRPNWPHAYSIGDAFASLHPAIGYGFAHSVTSACLAVDYYLKRDPLGYHNHLTRALRSKRLIARGLHHLLQRPRLSRAVSPLLETHDGMRRRLFKILDY